MVKRKTPPTRTDAAGGGIFTLYGHRLSSLYRGVCLAEIPLSKVNSPF